jgi:small-conductance mechanosensitive channel
LTASHPGVASQPSPETYIVTFTARPVTFQLRAWIDHYEDSAQLRSDLSIALKNALGREKIAIA